jgi:hypothetical protein
LRGAGFYEGQRALSSGSPTGLTVDEILAGRPDCSTPDGIWPDIDLCVQALKVDIDVVTTAELDHRARRTKDVDIAWYQFPADISFRARAARAGRRAAPDRE